MKRTKSFYITERHNPQFKLPYYIPHGQLSKADAKKKENTIYGTNIVLEFKNETEYHDKIAELKTKGFSVH